MDSESLTSQANELLFYAETSVGWWNFGWTLIILAMLFLLLFIKGDLSIVKVASSIKDRLFAFFQKLAKLKAMSEPVHMSHLFNALELLTAKSIERYDIPTYLALSVDTDLSSILGSIDAGHREKLILQQHKKEGDKDWYLFDQGCVINHPNPVEIIADLCQYRPERPLDGIIICVPSSQLLAREPIDIDKNAEILYQQLWQLQKKLEFILPVYLIITDCDQVSGFKRFWQFPDLHQHHDGIVGWSNPNDENQPYTQNWVREALNMVANKLRHIHINFIKTPAEADSVDALLFPANLAQLTSGLTRFCDTLFSGSSFHHSFMFRGIYFSGKLSKDKEQPPVDKFIEELFSKKIFKESNLAYPPQKKIFSSSKQLRFYQYISAGLFLSMSSWLAVDTINLTKQTKNLVTEIETISDDHHDKNHKKGIKYISMVLENIANMDASKLVHASIPWSWTTNLDEELIDYFAVNIFGRIVFPAFECQMNNLLLQQTNGSSTDITPVGWFEKTARLLELNGKLTELLGKTGFSEAQVAKRFAYLVKNLYNAEIPIEFNQRSTLYFNAIKDRSYPINQANQGQTSNTGVSQPANCQLAQIDKTDLWKQIKLKVDRQIQHAREQVQAPESFLSDLADLQSLPAILSWYQRAPDFSSGLQKYNHWTTNMQENWLKGHSNHNICQRINQSLNSMIVELEINDNQYAKRFFDDCNMAVHQQMEQDNSLMLAGLYQETDNEYQFTENFQKSSRQIKNISYLPFIHVSTPNHFDKDDSDFFWSVEHLNQALQMYDDYEAFAKQNYSSIDLPTRDRLKVGKYNNSKTDGTISEASNEPSKDTNSEESNAATNLEKNLESNPENTQEINREGTNRVSQNQNESYLAQAVVLKQLQLAMLTAVSDARVKETAQYKPDNFQPASQREAYLQSHIANFREAMNSLIEIHNKFERLNFSDTHQWFLNIANRHAFKLLKDVDNVYRDSRLYTPLPRPLWSAHKYTEALFGINGQGQLDDYLVAQSDRANFIAFKYAEPLLTFLKTTNARTTNYQLFSQWEKTLITLNKQLNKDPANDLNNLEQFFTNQLINTDQSNCFTQTKLFLEPQENNLFAASQNEIVKLASKHCTSFQADRIIQEYRQVSTLFSQLLASKYPFSKNSGRGIVSPQSMKIFLGQYSGKDSGLAQRMKILAWKKQEYKRAHQFILSLDESIDFFNYLFGASSGIDAPGIEIATDFNVLQTLASNVNHLSRWQLKIGNKFISYPGEKSSIFWLPENRTEFSLTWAEDSPYEATALMGKTRANQLIYKEKGVWSLLHFIQRHRSKSNDNSALTTESVLLDFSAKLKLKKLVNDNSDNSLIESGPEGSVDQNAQSALGFMRLTLYGLDPETKQKMAINIPKIFPHYAPRVK